MTWRFGASRRKCPDGSYHYEVREFYDMDDDGVWGSWTENGIVPSGETKEEVLETLRMMLADVEHYDAIEINPPKRKKR